ncbi:MAG: hypothetical protein U1E17_04895 [Geminicoccaceae bacterium]
MRAVGTQPRAVQRRFDTLQSQLVDGIAQPRLAPLRIVEMPDQGPITALEALAGGLVDHLEPGPRTRSTWLPGEVGRDVRPIELFDYSAHRPTAPPEATRPP